MASNLKTETDLYIGKKKDFCSNFHEVLYVSQVCRFICCQVFEEKSLRK